MISGCKDEQTSADVSNVSSFQVRANLVQFISSCFRIRVSPKCNAVFVRLQLPDPAGTDNHTLSCSAVFSCLESNKIRSLFFLSLS